MDLNTLREVLITELRDLYSAENQLIKALPEMAEGAHSQDLKAAFQEHLQQTKGHVSRLEQIFQKLNLSPKGETCEAMEGLIEEGGEMLELNGDPMALDAGIICAAQKVEHYEIAGYGSARTWARQLGMHDAADLLEQTLQEEKETDEKLNQIAESHVNVEAITGPSQR